MSAESNLTCICCGGKRHDMVQAFASPPEEEVAFPLGDAPYYRELWRCAGCGHFAAVHDYDLESLYEGDYYKASRGSGTDRFKRTFDKINGLDAGASDNIGRVERILTFANSYLDEPAPDGRSPTLLDVGSGLAVFPYRMRLAGWDCTALDPDPAATEHARLNAGVKGLSGNFLKLDHAETYDAITFNKVLEHVPDPIAMLSKSREFLRPGGFVYVELPDGEAAIDGYEREEFLIDHYHAFSFVSFSFLAIRSGLMVLEMERLIEPSGKRTLRAFLAEHPACAVSIEVKG